MATGELAPECGAELKSQWREKTAGRGRGRGGGGTEDRDTGTDQAKKKSDREQTLKSISRDFRHAVQETLESRQTDKASMSYPLVAAIDYLRVLWGDP